jgi:hypothetical protein
MFIANVLNTNYLLAFSVLDSKEVLARFLSRFSTPCSIPQPKSQTLTSEVPSHDLRTRFEGMSLTYLQ